METNINEAYNVVTFFKEIPLDSARLLLALIQGEVDARVIAHKQQVTAPAPEVKRGRPAGSRNRKPRAPKPTPITEAPVTEVKERAHQVAADAGA